MGFTCQSTMPRQADRRVSSSFRSMAEAMGRHLGVPATSVSADDVPQHFGVMGHCAGLDTPATAAATCELLGWQPTGPSLLEDLTGDHYYRELQVHA